MGVQLCASTSNVRKLRKCEISSIVIVQKFSHLTRPRPVFSSHGRLTNIIMVCTRFPYFVKSSMPRLNAILIHGPSSRPWETFTYRFDVTYSIQLSKNIAIHRIKTIRRLSVQKTYRAIRRIRLTRCTVLFALRKIQTKCRSSYLESVSVVVYSRY